MTLETGLFISQAIWLWRVRHVRREAKKVGMTYDQYVAKHPSKKIPRCDSEESVADVEACNNTTQISAVCTEKDRLGKEKCSETEHTDTESKKHDTWEQETLQKPPVAVVHP